MWDKFAPWLVAVVHSWLSCTVIQAVNRYTLQLYKNRFWSTCLYSIITSHKKEKFISQINSCDKNIFEKIFMVQCHSWNILTLNYFWTMVIAFFNRSWTNALSRWIYENMRMTLTFLYCSSDKEHDGAQVVSMANLWPF